MNYIVNKKTITQSLFCIAIILVSLHSLVAVEKKRAMVTGVTGQDGSYLVEFLLDKGYEVHGIMRPTTDSATAQRNQTQLQELKRRGSFIVHEADITDAIRVGQLVQETMPHEIYNLAAQSHVKTSFDMPAYTVSVDALAVYNFLEAIRKANLLKTTKFYQASTSELYGKSLDIPQKESTPFHPCSPYAIAKLCAYWAVVNYREAYGFFACNGILFNHESPRRGSEFVTRKITQTVAQIKYGLKETLYLGNLDAKRDWGYAKDYVECMWLMLQQDKADDFIIATGQARTVREFVQYAFKEIGVDIIWQGTGVDEKGIDPKTNKVLVAVDPQFFRPLEHAVSVGDASKAKSVLNWEPKTSFQDLVSAMVKADLNNFAPHA